MPLNVLEQRSAPRDVEQLEAAADGQNRKIALNGFAQQRALPRVAQRIGTSVRGPRGSP